jgi:hypothetical protein
MPNKANSPIVTVEAGDFRGHSALGDVKQTNKLAVTLSGAEISIHGCGRCGRMPWSPVSNFQFLTGRMARVATPRLTPTSYVQVIGMELTRRSLN